MSDYFSNNSTSSQANVSMSDLLKYYQNPYDNIAKIRKASKYFTNKYGILRDVHRMVRSLPTLKYSLMWASYEDKERNLKQEKKVKIFLEDIDVIKMLRDGLYSTALNGTTVTCLRNKKYVQFLNLDDIVIRKIRNGRWIVEFDMKSLDSISNTKDKINMINSLPDEVTLSKYNTYREKRDDSVRYVELTNCHVINIDAERDNPFGIPLTMGSWISLAQKEIIDNVERSVADRLIKQILILTASSIKDKNGIERPVPPEVINAQFKNVSKLIRAKEGKGTSKDDSATGVIAFPDIFKLEALNIDTTLFKKDLYDKINDDIYSSLGVSKSLISGDGGNFSSASINSEKFLSFIFTIIEQFEKVINDYLEIITPKNLECRIKFDRTTSLDKKSEYDMRREFYMQTGVISPLIETIFGENSFKAIYEQAKYERELGTESVFFPPQNAYTSSGKDSSINKPETESPTNDNTERTKSNDGNNTPSPND